MILLSDFESNRNQRSNSDGLESKLLTIRFGSPNHLSLKNCMLSTNYVITQSCYLKLVSRQKYRALSLILIFQLKEGKIVKVFQPYSKLPEDVGTVLSFWQPVSAFLLAMLHLISSSRSVPGCIQGQ